LQEDEEEEEIEDEEDEEDDIEGQQFKVRLCTKCS
jgi:hypothetical protein